MGRHKKFARGSKRSRDDGTYVDRRNTYTNNRGYTLHAKESKLFEQYYKGQKLVPEAEWDSFMASLLKPLPCTFRVTGFKSHAKEMLSIVKKDYLNNIMPSEQCQSEKVDEEEQFNPPKCLQWYPDELAWQIDLGRKAIRQESKLKNLHQFLIQETESGYISRQEAVSMIPPLVLDVKPGSKVLDMCAAPGSKTAQLIEFLHPDENTNSDGFVIANDSDNKRCYLMVHQLNRLLSPNYAVVNMDASVLPNFAVPESNPPEVIKFDRILCDVPCSGDGTLRKNVDAWQRWNPGSAHGLHNLQKRILKRGIEMLAEGGKIVYSTCSFNPVEDEAVVAHILRTMKGVVELVDFGHTLPGLQFESGRSHWRVMTKNEEWFEKFEDVPEKLHTQLGASLFPPTPQEAAEFNLHKCIRILPHKQDTGGFFVALFQKKEETSSNTAKDDEEVGNESEVVEVSEQNDDTNKKRKQMEDDSRPAKKPRHFGYKEDPFIFLQQDDPLWKPICDFYGIKEDFPFSQLMVRCEQGKKRNMYFVSSNIKSLAKHNEDKFKFINFGVKILSRSLSKDVECQFRLVQDGLHLLFPYITKRIVNVTKDDVVTLLSSENPYISRFSKNAAEKLSNLEQGGCVFVYEPHPELEGPKCKLILSGWSGKVSCRSFLPKADRGHFLRLCGAELISGYKKANTVKDAGNEGEAESKEDDIEDISAVEVAEDNEVECPLEEEDEKVDEESGDIDVAQDSCGTGH